MGCNCGKSQQGVRGAVNQMRVRNNPNRIPVKVRIKDWSTSPMSLIGARTGVGYGVHVDGDELLMWKSDVMAAPAYFEILETPS